MAISFFLTVFSPFYNCFGYTGEASNSSNPDALAPVFEDGPTQIDGCSGYRRHYIKGKLPNNKYQVACQMSQCYFNSGGDTATLNWIEYIIIGEGELCRSKRGKELLDDYLLCKGYHIVCL
ncbi:uncharacterized protein ACHE_10941A [Aspergillus chevalieri]|uniref:Uncharacterized protein n=1 Tax=Aspergillus chevalieri TaxID=182096 RepID=A0A7R7ZJH2_ASPCH|nr:uncharacterized protein ACHE_10941A [Aspergillus chevalieri]BCR83539.1 hypothetical protein ACHE_10941A [Aspergillus chevalieri]